MTDHNLLPKHGVTLIVADAEGTRRIKEICLKQRRGSLLLGDLLAVLLINDRDKTIMLPCRQCALDIALEFHDLGELLKELAELK